MIKFYKMKKNKSNKFYIRHGKKEDLKILDFIQSKNFKINNLPVASKEFLLSESIVLVVCKKWSKAQYDKGSRNLLDITYEKSQDERSFIRKIIISLNDILLRFTPPEDHILGFITLRKIFKDYHVMMIVVRKEQRGKGIGELLTIGAFDEAKYNKIDTISLEVEEKNSHAINLYKKYGFMKKGLRKNYYDGENALIFTTPRIKSYIYTKSLFMNVDDYVKDKSNHFSKKMSNFKRKSIFLD